MEMQASAAENRIKLWGGGVVEALKHSSVDLKSEHNADVNILIVA